MAKLKIKYVGPIKEGLGGEFIQFDGVTVFMGDQGTGKSTIAKMYSTMSWLEKAFVKEDIKPGEVNKYNRFLRKYLKYQNLSDYTNEKTQISYEGDAYTIEFSKEGFKAKRHKSISRFLLPKIMYIPAERNFVTAVDRPELVKRLPLPLYDFLDEYEIAKSSLKSVELPIGQIKYEYNSNTKKSFLVGDDFKINLLESSSGFQSLVPLLLVSIYLSNLVNQKLETSRSELNREEQEKIRLEIIKFIEKVKKGNITKDVIEIALEEISAKQTYRCFINIVEELEQNLFPNSQEQVLYKLLEVYNSNPKNQLILTTHSPYLINYLTLAVKAFQLKGKNIKQDIVPPKSALDPQRLNIYELKDGDIKLLKPYNGLPSDENFLNKILGDFNDKFVSMLDIENS